MYKDIKHISFDVWNTLITPNKDYSAHRNEAIATHFNITVEEAKLAYQNCKNTLDNLALIRGIGLSTNDAWLLLQLNMNKCSLNDNELIDICDELFKKYPPTFSTELKSELVKLHDRGFSLSIKSNTNFIKGTVLNEVLFDSLDIFEFKHYSDDFENSKPSPIFFTRTQIHVPNIKVENILHIGDNLICDGGCQKLGWNYLHVKNPNDLLTKLQNQEIV